MKKIDYCIYGYVIKPWTYVCTCGLSSFLSCSTFFFHNSLFCKLLFFSKFHHMCVAWILKVVSSWKNEILCLCVHHGFWKLFLCEVLCFVMNYWKRRGVCFHMWISSSLKWWHFNSSFICLIMNFVLVVKVGSKMCQLNRVKKVFIIFLMF